jgi:integrase
MHLTLRKSGWRFQIRIPRDVEPVFGRSPIRLNLGPIAKRRALRVARLLTGRAETVFMLCRKGADMAKDERDKLIEDLQKILAVVVEISDRALEKAEWQRKVDVQTVAKAFLTEKLAERQEFIAQQQTIRGKLNTLHESVSKLPKPARDGVADQIAELSELVRQSLDGGPPRPLASEELKRWTIDIRKGHAADKKVRTDRNRIADFLDFAGDRPVNKYRYSDFQSFANLLARVPANYVKEPRTRNMTRQEAADYNDGLPPARRFETLSGKAIDTNYFSPLRMFFRAMAAEHDFRSPLSDISVTIPIDAKESTERSPFTVEDLNLWFKAAAKEKRADLKWLPLLGTLTGARVGELIFLQGKDIYQVSNGWWVADLTTSLDIPDGSKEKRQIKNAPSRRLFALHEVLTEVGFIDYCQSRSHDDWLFPAAFLHGKERVKDPADAASKRLNTRLKNVGIHKPLENTFHSTRHTAKDIMRVAKIDPRTADRQTGHAPRTVGENYGKKTLRNEEVEVLAVLPLPEGLDLSPYHQKERSRKRR